MRANQIRFHLHNYKQLQAQVNEYIDQLNQYRQMEINAFTVPVPKEGGRREGFVDSPTENIVIPRLAYIEKLENRIFTLQSILFAINTVMHRYDTESIEHQILQKRYFRKFRGKCQSWESIALDMAYSVQNVYKLDRKLISEIQEEYDDNTKA